MSDTELTLEEVQDLLSHAEGIEYRCKTVGEWGGWSSIDWKMFLGVYKQNDKYQFRKAGKQTLTSIDELRERLAGSEWVSITTSVGKTIILTRKDIESVFTK